MKFEWTSKGCQWIENYMAKEWISIFYIEQNTWMTIDKKKKKVKISIVSNPKVLNDKIFQYSKLNSLTSTNF